VKRTLIIAVAVVAACQFTPAQVRGKKAGTARPAATVEQSLKKLNQSWDEAYLRRDAALLARIWAEGFVLTNPSGEVKTRAEMLEELGSGAATFQVFKTEDAQVRSYGQMAVVTGRATLRGEYKKQPVGGQYCYTRVYLNRLGRWQAVAYQIARMAEQGGETMEGEVTTPSGLKYVDLEVGTGESPQRGQMAIVHYTGTLTDGTKFDSSLDRGQPFAFQIGMGKVIQGWDEGVMTMKVGGKRKLIIPPHLGYGARGAGNVIPPNATLVFEVELLEVR
jgi:peptidylprolyl isomerase